MGLLALGSGEKYVIKCLFRFPHFCRLLQIMNVCLKKDYYPTGTLHLHQEHIPSDGIEENGFLRSIKMAPHGAEQGRKPNTIWRNFCQFSTRKIKQTNVFLHCFKNRKPFWIRREGRKMEEGGVLIVAKDGFLGPGLSRTIWRDISSRWKTTSAPGRK